MQPEVTSVHIDEATPDQLRSFATRFLNLDIPNTASDDEVKSAIDRALPGTVQIWAFADAKAEEQVMAEAEAAAAAPDSQVPTFQDGSRQVGSLGRDDPRYTIRIPSVETNDKSGQLPVLVGVNGRAWEIKRDVDVSIPARVFEALKNATGVNVRHEAVHGDPSQIEEVKTATKRYAVEVVERPSSAALEEWHERTDALLCP